MLGKWLQQLLLNWKHKFTFILSLLLKAQLKEVFCNDLGDTTAFTFTDMHTICIFQTNLAQSSFSFSLVLQYDEHTLNSHGIHEQQCRLCAQYITICIMETNQNYASYCKNQTFYCGIIEIDIPTCNNIIRLLQYIFLLSIFTIDALKLYLLMVNCPVQSQYISKFYDAISIAAAAVTQTTDRCSC